MNEFQKYLVSEFVEDYEEGRISRRKALRLILGVTGSLVLTNSILAACTPAKIEVPEGTPGGGETAAPATGATPMSTLEPTVSMPDAPTAPATAAMPAGTETPAAGIPATGTQAPHGTVAPDDPAVVAGPLEFAGEPGTLMGYLARPAGDGPFPVVLVCHENRGLTPHIEDVTRRLAKAGYVSLAVDLLSRQGGSAALASDDVPGALGNIEPDQFVSDFQSGLRYLEGQAFAQTDRVGMVGFCFGGGVTWRAATHMPELLAAVPYYGPHPPVEDVPNIQAAVLAIYGELDQRINAGIPVIEEAMAANSKLFEYEIYPNADHAFNNDTSPRYNPEAAQAAWARTLAWFEQYVRG